jgi:signal transduction histidine kinase
VGEDIESRLADAYEERVRVLNLAVQERERELMILSQVAARVHGADSEAAILDIGIEEILTRMELQAAWILTGDENDKLLRLAASRGLAPGYLEDVRRSGLSPCLCREVFWTGHRMQARNTTHCPRMPDIIAGLDAPVAHACIPLRFDGARLGVLNVAALPGQVFSEEQLRFLDTLGHQISLAVERARYREAERARDRETRAALAELKQAQSRIIQTERMAVLGTFASGLAHEVRNPLNSMALQLSILDRRIAKCDPVVGREMSELAAIIREEIQRLDGLVGDFLLFSRVSRVDVRAVPLREVLDEVVRLLKPEAGAASITLHVTAEGVGPEAAVEPEKMKQVVINLVRNALEATPPGGSVRVRSVTAEGLAVLEVSDDGPGLPEGIALFEPFVTTKPKGTGLGLSIVQQIVTQHGGEIRAENRVGASGAVFTVSLPLATTGRDATA